MHFKQFHDSVYATAVGSDVKRQTLCYDYQIVETVDGKVFVDRELTDVS